MELQGTPEWHAARCGKVTASRVADVIGRIKAGWAAPRAAYMGQLLAERLTGAVADTFTTPAMRWGTEKEPEARTAYEFEADVGVELVGFLDHPRIDMSGASPDGLVGSDGLVEFKCPQTVTHIDTLIAGAMPDKHVAQVQWQLAVTGRAWCDFVSFDPRLPDEKRMLVVRVQRDDALIASHEQMVAEFIGELEARLYALNERYPTALAA